MWPHYVHCMSRYQSMRCYENFYCTLKTITAHLLVSRWFDKCCGQILGLCRMWGKIRSLVPLFGWRKGKQREATPHTHASKLRTFDGLTTCV